ncbi:MAG: hypothetical protein HYX71_05110 [Opitutae bacterium]|nr:hypothetical protein [Opitutae bacterium]
MPKKPASKKSSRLPQAIYPDYDAIFRPEDAIVAEGPDVLQPSKLACRDDACGLYLYHGDCLEVMDTLRAKHPKGVFDLIFADPPFRAYPCHPWANNSPRFASILRLDRRVFPASLHP